MPALLGELWIMLWLVIKCEPQGRGAGGAGRRPVRPPAARAEQHEFLFNEHESRGYFDKTDRNLFEGQDLDVPTYLRKGVKIAV